MSRHPDKLKFFISASTEESLKNHGFDVITVQQGRFASYVEREIQIQSTNLSIFINYTAIPEGFLLIEVSLDTMFNSLIVGHNREFLPIARHKYKYFNENLTTFEQLRNSPPKPGDTWLGIDHDPNDGAEITIICAAHPIDRKITSDAEAIIKAIKGDAIRNASQHIIDVGLNILLETADPINPITDTLKFKKQEFLSDIRNPRKLVKVVTNSVLSSYIGEEFPLYESLQRIYEICKSANE